MIIMESKFLLYMNIMMMVVFWQILSEGYSFNFWEMVHEFKFEGESREISVLLRGTPPLTQPKNSIQNCVSGLWNHY